MPDTPAPDPATAIGVSAPPGLAFAPVAAHPNIDHRISPWADEQIWGHRVYGGQSPWLLFLEFLNVAEAFHRKGELLCESGGSYPLNYRLRTRMYLRNVVWNHALIQRIDDETRDSQAAWKQWLDWIGENALGVPTRDFSYLRSQFADFRQFASLVDMISGAAVEGHANRRWTSRFVFPFGTNGLYTDLTILPTGKPGIDYINFGRTGELVYQMLCRSAHADALRPHLKNILADTNDWNKLLGLLQPPDDDGVMERGQAYLPYAWHPQFDRLAEDWGQIFSLGLPAFDALPHLVTLGALHVMLYHATVAAQWAGWPKAPHFVCEILAPKKTLVRELSFINFRENDTLPALAAESFLDGLRQSETWKRANADAMTADDAFMRCRKFLKETVWWGDEYDGPHDTSGLMDSLREDVLARQKQHVANVHRGYGREVGLVSRRGTNKYRYAPNDPLLKTLLFANVPKRTELRVALGLLYERYGFVVGEGEAQDALNAEDFDKKAFAANAQRLERRLNSLGMLRRLSDGCAYVENPLA